MTQPTFAHIQGHIELAEQSIQLAYTQLKIAREKLKELCPDEKKDATGK